MKDPASISRLLLPLAALAVAACAASEPPPPIVAPEPIVFEAPPAEPEIVPALDPDTPLHERWLSPFAVSSAGRVVPLEPRRVAVLNADALIVSEPAAENSGPTAAAAPGDRNRESSDTTRPTEPRRGPGGEPATESSGDTPPTRTAEPSVPTTRGARPPDSGAEPAPVGPPASGATSMGSHLVQRGETWYGIAQRYRVSPRALAEANPSVDPERIRIGQSLRVPQPASADPARTHRVAAGDTLWGIARRYGVTAEEIRRVNRLPDDRVRLGQTLVIP